MMYLLILSEYFHFPNEFLCHISMKPDFALIAKTLKTVTQQNTAQVQI